MTLRQSLPTPCYDIGGAETDSDSDSDYLPSDSSADVDYLPSDPDVDEAPHTPNIKAVSDPGDMPRPLHIQAVRLGGLTNLTAQCGP